MAHELRFPRINSIIISGRLTRDVELRYTPKGSPVARIPIAFDNVWKDANGEWQQESHFIDVVAWNKLAETSAERLHKGSPVIVEGNLKTRTYVNKENQNVKIVEISASRISNLEKNDDYSGTNDVSEPKFSNNSLEESVTDDDVPF
ncbi:MAG: single-stranded DNA-binding protein [Candidatus Cloacimonetes bacterium]|nr:single-stranded DNA-binding protein [Candidatus Cloacimonadota bacterium]